MPILSRKSIHSERNCSTVNIPFLECSLGEKCISQQNLRFHGCFNFARKR